MRIATMQIESLLKRDLSEKIEEIVKLTQDDEQTVYTELTEYVATNRIRDQYRDLLRAMADAPRDPRGEFGVWISGFFGSGKSSFAKNLGYVLANRSVLGHRAADLFVRQLDDPAVTELVRYLTTNVPTEVIMFDVSVDRAVRNTNQKLAEIMYTVLLRELGYAEDFDIAELEIELEGEGTLAEFERVCRSQNDDRPWAQVRIGAQRMNRASAILHEMNPRMYPQADSWARGLAGRSADITVARLVDRTFELMRRRRPGRALTFIIDEVGQYVARSGEKLEDLRGIVERFSQESKRHIRQRTAIAPVWVLVTSQEKLDEVVAAIDSRRVELARVQDRFSYRVDLAPADIKEVATRRVLEKKPDAVPELRQVFARVQGQLNSSCRLERTSRQSEVRESDFVQFYPYLPHFIELSIDIMSGIRLQPGAPRHLGGSNRTIIKQAHEMLVSPRTNLAAARVGRLVTLDQIYELVEGNLSSEKQKDISDIAERFKGDRQDGGWAARVAKAIALLEFVRDLPRSEANVAAVLVDEAGATAPLPQVKAALARLEQAQFVRHTEEGWKLQTAQEKRWETERQGFDPRPRERNEIARDTLSTIFTSDAKVSRYQHQGQHTFDIGLTVDDRLLKKGDIPLTVLVADEPSELARRLDEARDNSRSNAHQDEVYWVFALTPEAHELIGEVYRSGQMVNKYNQIGAQGERAAELAPLLEAEKRELERVRSRLKEKMEAALAAGQGIFRGASKDASDLGKSVPEIFRALFAWTVPDLYPKLEMGARRLTGKEADDVLKAANLNALPQVFYGGEQGLGLVVKDNGKFVPNVHAEIAQEVLQYLKNEQQYGNRVTGKELEARFTGLGYGWDLDVIRLVLALLLRAGAIEVTYQGRRYRNALDPQSRTPLTTPTAFRGAAFTPRESIDLKMMRSAVLAYEELTGDEVDFEEGAIAEALKRLANDEVALLLPVRAEVKANALPGGDVLDDYYQVLAGIQGAASDDCVRTLAGEGTTLKELRAKARRIRESLGPDQLAAIRQARRAVHEQWPVLQADGRHAALSADAGELGALLTATELYQSLPRVRDLAGAIGGAYEQAYHLLHERRFERFAQALDDVKGSQLWLDLVGGLEQQTAGESREQFEQRKNAYEQRQRDLEASLLAPLDSRACLREPQLGAGDLTCAHCHATVSQMESDLDAADALVARVLRSVEDRIPSPSPEAGGEARPVRRLRAREYFAAPLTSEADVEDAVNRLRDELHKLIAQGVSIVIE